MHTKEALVGHSLFAPPFPPLFCASMIASIPVFSSSMPAAVEGTNPLAALLLRGSDNDDTPEAWGSPPLLPTGDSDRREAKAREGMGETGEVEGR